MKRTVTFYEFRRAFEEMRPDNFTHEGLGVLFEHLEELEDETGEELEFDVIGICCDYSEDSWEDIADNYDIDLSECETDEEKREAVREYLEDQTMVAGDTEAGFVYRQF